MVTFNISDFYILHERLLKNTLQVHPIGLNYETDISGDDDVLCLLTGNYTDIKLPVEFKQTYGKNHEDIIRTGHAILYLISDKFREVLLENHLTGWQTFPVIVRDKDGIEISGYHGLSIIGRCGPVDYTKCNIVEKRKTQEGALARYYQGLYVDLKLWDESDFFLAEGYFGTIITKKAQGILEKNKLTNLEFSNLKSIESSEYMLKILNKLP